ncbi:MAG: hypothetical protein E7536_02895 [Ruminococcaceae bacterium]|nr:hypothetical protein [Oscillospiraceae bacterium]
MKGLFYFLYSVFFHICRIFPVKTNRVVLLSPHNANFKDSLMYIQQEFAKRGDFSFVYISSRELDRIPGAIKFFTVKAYLLATAKYIFLNDTFMPMANLNFSKKSVIVQLWHGQGILKKFVMDTNLEPSVRKNAQKCADKYTYVVVSSKKALPICAGAFGVKEEKCLPLGQPASDALYKDTKTHFYETFPELKGRKTILYAPTFRDDPEADKQILENFDIEKFNRELGDEYSLLIRLHPQIHTSVPEEGVFNATSYDDVNELIRECDILITDYSSICMEFSMLKKPMLFFAYDLEKYKNDRDLYFEYESYVPGKVVKTSDEMIKAIKEKDFAEDKNAAFREFNFDFFDGKSSERLADYLLKK